MTIIQLNKHALLLVQDEMEPEPLRHVVKQIYATRLAINLLRQIVQLPSINLITLLLFSCLTYYLLFY
jgi:hypothetical protein